MRQKKLFIVAGIVLMVLVMIILVEWILRSFSAKVGERMPDCYGETADCRLLLRTLKTLPSDCASHIRSLAVRDDAPDLGGFTSVYGDMWIAGDVEPQQMRALLIHECAHVIDFFAHVGKPAGRTTSYTVRGIPVFDGDPSARFYVYSWQTSLLRTPESLEEDFVTAYAMANPAEDFAESYAYFVLAGSAFKERARKSAVLQKKYDFIAALFPKGYSVAKSDAWDGVMLDSTSDLQYAWLVAER